MRSIMAAKIQNSFRKYQRKKLENAAASKIQASDHVIVWLDEQLINKHVKSYSIGRQNNVYMFMFTVFI